MSTRKAISYIRFSRDHQAQGDSLRRQQESTQEYCRRNNLLLDESFDLQDLGVSAFRGKNANSGALSRFLDACDRGLVEKGTALIVENLDRLSRQSPRRTVLLLTTLLDLHQIEVHLTQVNKVFVPERDEGTDLIFAVALAMRAHEESQAKSSRLKAAFKTKRLRAASGEVILHPVIPWWCLLKDGKITCPPERSSVVVRVFELTAKGWSSAQVARLFCKEGVPTWRRKQKEWTAARVRDLVRGDSALGHINSSTKATREHSLENYYPRIVQDELAAEARAAMARNTRGSRGRAPAPDRPSNILRGLLRHRGNWCRFTNHRTGHRDPVTKIKGFNSQFESMDGVTGKSLFSIPARQLEPVLLTALSELDSSDLRPIRITGVPPSTHLKSKVAELEAKVENLVAAVESGSISIASRLTVVEETLKLAKKDLASALTRETISSEFGDKSEILSIGTLKARLKDSDSRLLLSASIHRIISRIDIGRNLEDLELSSAFRGRIIRQVRNDGPEGFVDESPQDRPRRPIFLLVSFVGGAKRLIVRDTALAGDNRIMSIRIEIESNDTTPLVKS